MPTDRPREWFARGEDQLAWCRLAAARCVHLERRPQLIHVHRYDVDCDGGRHERVGTVEQLELEGFRLGSGVVDASTHVGSHSQRGLVG